MIDLGNVARLVDALVIAVGENPVESGHAPPLPAPPALFEDQADHEETAQVLGALISRYGVSGTEEPVRDRTRQAASW